MVENQHIVLRGEFVEGHQIGAVAGIMLISVEQLDAADTGIVQAPQLGEDVRAGVVRVNVHKTDHTVRYFRAQFQQEVIA